MVVSFGQPLRSKEPVRPVQSEKAELPMVVSFGQPLKSKEPVRSVQSKKAELPMVVRAGQLRFKVVRPVQSEKA